jgi:broad specificity phosphatase PhoE
MAKRIYFVRHGESEHNVQKLIAGHVNSPLTEKGRQQAIETGKKAREQGLYFDIILSSPLERAHHTAKTIADHVDYPHENIYLLEELKERYFGELEEQTLESIGMTYDEYRANPFALDHYKDIETIIDMQFRANQLLDYLKGLPRDTILVVSHGSFGRALRRAATNAPLTEFGESIDNAELFRLL